MKPICTCHVYQQTAQHRLEVPFCFHTHHIQALKGTREVLGIRPVAVRKDWREMVVRHIEVEIALNADVLSPEEKRYLLDIAAAVERDGLVNRAGSARPVPAPKWIRDVLDEAFQRGGGL